MPAATKDQHERGFTAFVEPRMREKYRSAFNTPKKRKALALYLFHHSPFDDQSVYSYIDWDTTPDIVQAELEELGAPYWCWFLRSSGKWGEAPLPETLERLVGPEHFGAVGFVSCVPAEVAYYQGEDTRFILRRPLLQDNAR